MATDQFQSLATISATEAVAGTLLFQELQTGIGFGSQRGMLIDKIQFYIAMTFVNLILDESDRIVCAITLSNGITDIENFTDRRIIDNYALGESNFGTPASAQHVEQPITHDFGHGLPLAESSLYLAIVGVSLASAITVRTRIFFRYIDLTDRAILEIAQNFQLVG